MTQNQTERPGPAAAAEWPLWEVFVRPKAGLDHKHCGSLHAADPKMAVQMAREDLAPAVLRRQQRLGGALRPDRRLATPAIRTCSSTRPTTRCTATPPSTSRPDSVDHM